jgi:hypothetical protein
VRARAAQLVQLIIRYWTRRVLDDEILNVLQTKLAYEVVMFCQGSGFVKPSADKSAVSFHSTATLPHTTSLAKPHLVHINMAKLCLNTICVTLSKAYSLRVVTPESLLSIKREADIATEAILVLRFDARG